MAIGHVDVSTAFLNPEADVPDQPTGIPEGWYSDDASEPGTGIAAGSVVRLGKALYGLKQSPRLWHKDIDDFLVIA